MAKQQTETNPFIERMKDRFRDFVDGIADVIGEAVSPKPQPVRIPVRR
jgi:hypothetical protein